MINNYLLIAISGVLTLNSCGISNEIYNERKISINSDWNFHLNDSIKDRDTISAATQWRKLDLPHDWSIEGRFDEKVKLVLVVAL